MVLWIQRDLNIRLIKLGQRSCIIWWERSEVGKYRICNFSKSLFHQLYKLILHFFLIQHSGAKLYACTFLDLHRFYWLPERSFVSHEFQLPPFCGWYLLLMGSKFLAGPKLAYSAVLRTERYSLISRKGWRDLKGRQVCRNTWHVSLPRLYTFMSWNENVNSRNNALFRLLSVSFMFVGVCIRAG